MRKILTASRKGISTYQHLKFWQDYFTDEYYISFYANDEIPQKRHFEFPLAIFEQPVITDGQMALYLNFIVHPVGRLRRPPTIQHKYGSLTSRKDSWPQPFILPYAHGPTSSSSHSSSSRSSYGPSSNSSYDTPWSSTTSDAGAGQSESQNQEQVLKSLAIHMKYLKIEFSDVKGKENLINCRCILPLLTEIPRMLTIQTDL